MAAPWGVPPPPLLRERPSHVQPVGTRKRTLVNAVPSTFRYAYVPGVKRPLEASTPKYTAMADGVGDGVAVGIGSTLMLASAAALGLAVGLRAVRSAHAVSAW